MEHGRVKKDKQEVEMELEIKVTRKSISSHWFLNVFLVMAAAVIILETVLCLSLQTRYYNSVHSAAREYTKDLSLLATCDYENFSDTAKEYVEQFEHKDKLELQIIDRSGTVIFASNGFEPTAEEMPDYKSAMQNGGPVKWIGKNAAGEKVMAETTVLTDFGNGSNGAVRWVVSLRPADSKLLLTCLICVLIGLAFLFLCWVSGVYFIRSIVRPVEEVSKMARKIAMGDFDTRIAVPKESEIAQLCDSINFMASELKSAEQMKNDFISSVSHELRTPLTAIRGWGETAKMSVGTDDEIVKKGLDVVLAESERLSGLVEELLDFSRIQSGRLKIETGSLDIGKTLSDAVDMYYELAKQQEIDLSFFPVPNTLFVEGDRDRLKQVYINIIDNAIKYTEKGGNVIISQYEEEGVVITKVTDTGVGIPAQDIDRVKEKFFKSNKKVRGSGIGLAVADEIVKQHNGLLFIESKEGEGTTVTVALPSIVPEEEIVEEIIPPASEVEVTADTEETKDE
ncbi:MAG: HAMP domain-containing histidine kinase [Clostridia bacterium]|nr:HAMP domain-containing histidine kinase [Clostridia bacterium]